MQKKDIYKKYIEISNYSTDYQCSFCKKDFESSNEASNCCDNDWKELNEKERFCPVRCKHWDIPQDIKKCNTCKRLDFCYPHINHPIKSTICNGCWNTENEFKCNIKKEKTEDLYKKMSSPYKCQNFLKII